MPVHFKKPREIKQETEKQMEQENKESLIDVLKLVSPGSVLRTAIDDILRAGMGALIVLESPGMDGLIEGGFKVNSDLTPQKIVELAKMDGAIILSSDLKKILHANVVLIPDTRIPTNETGTRHKAAERTAAQAETLIIAISERRKKISVYHGDLRYILQNTEDILRRATESLQILEKQREIFDELLSNLNVLEISGLVVISDVCAILQRISMIIKVSAMIERYLIELGKEGLLVKMRLRELLKNVKSERGFILKDYNIEDEKLDVLSEFGFDEVLNVDNIAGILFSCPPEEKISPKGYRILNKTNLIDSEIDNLIKELGNLDNILSLEPEKLNLLLKEKSENFQKNISSLKEQIMVGKKI